ncbi:MAG: tyrosine-type recombinase/integrase [Thermoplasmatales archaeon]|nr:tyrosine-type recombinase/integrase [Thermoplasmatales archaeon]
MLKGQNELEKFLESLKADKRSKHTVYLYGGFLKQMLEYINKEPKDITLDDLNRYKMHMANELNYNANSLITHIAAIKTFFRTLDLNTANKLKEPKRPKLLPEPLTEDEIRKILIKAKNTNPMDYAILCSLYYLGCRKTELTNLNIDDIDFLKRTVRINKGKGNKDSIVSIHQDALEALKEYILHNRRLTIDDSNAVFVSTHGRRISRATVERTVKKYAAKAGITKRVYPHLFRHSLGTHMAQQGANAMYIQKQLAHENIATTMKYVHLADKDSQIAYDIYVHSLMKPKDETVQTAQQLTNEKKLELLETRFLNGEVPSDIYRQLKAKYEDKEKHQEPEKKENPLWYIG